MQLSSSRHKGAGFITAENKSAPLVITIEYNEETDKKKRNTDNPINYYLADYE
jgi:cold shock CspA family protein